ncbi:hypothetical protein ACIOTI_26335 [Streptomyces sp. NPDC087843]|uniref:hypothetical protein n=1 Tax=Streptomyces sp. NPDC087843 TaxID=3365804 RepID=UPI00380CF0A3
MTHFLDELTGQPKSLSYDLRVYVGAGRLRPPDEPGDLTKAVAEQVHALVVELCEGYRYRFAHGTAGPVSASQIAVSLYPKSPAEATALLGELASADLMFPGFAFTDRAEAETIAACVVRVLGPRACWWSNRDDLSVDVSPASRSTRSTRSTSAATATVSRC